MKRRVTLAPRREPQQARSRQMHDDILTAAIRVLRREGPLRFTTPRVAEAAGISVGSLYQYFPNKEALLFALHTRAVEQAWVEVKRILEHPRQGLREKLRRIARLYFAAESEEVAEMGALLQEAEIFFADQPEHRSMQAKVERRFVELVRGALPHARPATIAREVRAMIAVLESTGRALAPLRLPARRSKRWADACADMVSTQLGLPEIPPARAMRADRPLRPSAEGGDRRGGTSGSGR